ncbi:hypothetical protein ISF6_5129 [Piscinibacter sakaiensis]|uniref:Uncharacterized protein n=2 Tax=Piscinibacter sakaiensis TaxID=1547922 RepID=A0A0K8P7G9_PISS1|nr:hypothetical protein ISF6_5129 [Piscinibacter sakaiensis]
MPLPPPLLDPELDPEPPVAVQVVVTEVDPPTVEIEPDGTGPDTPTTVVVTGVVVVIVTELTEVPGGQTLDPPVDPEDTELPVPDPRPFAPFPIPPLTARASLTLNARMLHSSTAGGRRRPPVPSALEGGRRRQPD